ncbi:diguanylate cyclase domain-containing protein [Azotobacter salinestris]|uniref:diguanylate cyclase domain-containing protein n=1 Tax=Azotobacter salinestris TaxID=69964 RepID=UPI001266D02E|nr:diguanylate cyclase [Azotobacter salinestris]
MHQETHTPQASAPVPDRLSTRQLLRRIRLVEFGGILCTGILVGLATLLPMHWQSHREVEQSLEFHLHTQAQAASQLFAHYSSLASQLTSRTQIRNAMERHASGQLSRAELGAYAAPRLRDALQHSPELLGLVRLDRDGHPLARLGLNPPESLWQLPEESGDAQQRHGPFMLDGRAVLVIGTPILAHDGQRLGTDIATFGLASLEQVLSGQPPHAGAVRWYLAHLADGNLAQFAGSVAGFVRLAADHPLHALLADLPALAVPAPDHASRLAFADRLPGLPDWALILTAEDTAIHAFAARELRWPIIAILLLMLFSSALTFIAVRPLARRIIDQAQHLALAANVIRCSGEGILLLDAQRRILEINPAGCRMLGQDEARLHGTRLCALTLPNGEEQCEAAWQRSEQTGHWQGELPLRCADGTLIARLSLVAVRDESGALAHYSLIITDVTAQKAAEARIRQQAHYDELTGLPNRALMQDRLTQALRQARRSGSPLAVLFLDLDHFKQVNDNHGHALGDRLLQAVAERLTDIVREADSVARLGGDEFLAILTDTPPEGTALVAAKIVRSLQEPFLLDGHELHIGTSIGISLYPQHGESHERLVEQADAAMYAAKKAGRNTHRFWSAGLAVTGSADA